MVRRELRPLLAAALLGVAVAAAVATDLVPSGMLAGLPLLMLVVPLLGGRYVGEERLEALAASWRARRRRTAPAKRAAATFRVLPRTQVVAARGGLLLASSLAERGPPAPAGARV